MSPQPPKNVPSYRVSPNLQRDKGKFSNDQRFPGNHFLELKAMRPSMRAYSIKNKLISDPENRTDLSGAITVVGTCLDMCPEYERHEREFQKDVDDWEKIPGTNPKRIDHSRAVKKYRRSAAGNDEPLESDLRPPEVLKMTLNYLFYELLDKHGLEATYAFIRDRTRAIRTDFTIQHDKGPIAVECFERIARFHILALHRFCERDDVRGFDYWQEVEQMMKTLQSLMQFYDDNEGKLESPNEAEFRSYYILAHFRDTNSLRRLQALAPHVFLDPTLQTALEFRSYAQRNTHLERRSSSHRAAKLRFRNSEACMNAFTRFFKRVRNKGTSYLMGCLLEYHFGGVRKGAIHALWKAYTARHRPLPTADLMEMLGIDDEEKTIEVAHRFGMVVVEETEEPGVTSAVQLNKNSKFEHANQMAQRHSIKLVESKRDEHTDVDIVDGNFDKAYRTWRLEEPELPQTSPQTSLKLKEVTTNEVHPPFRNATAISFPQSSTTSLTSLAPPTSKYGVFDQYLATQPSSVSDIGSVAFQNPTIPQRSVTSGTAPQVSPPKVVSTASSPVSTSAVPPWTASPASFSVQDDHPVLSLPVSRTQSVLTSPSVQAAQPSVATIVSIQTKPPFPVPISASVPADVSPLPETLSPDTNAPATPKSPSPPRPTQEELLYARQQEFRRVVAAAVAQAEQHSRLQVLLQVFTFWKQRVVERGHTRELNGERQEQFKRSIRDMGLSGTAADKGKGKQKAEYQVEEDLVSWEDTSQASLSASLQRRSRKSFKRADDEATLNAIQEVEAMRIKLWEPGTFLSSIVERLHYSPSLPCGWAVWLSTTSQSLGTAEWLRLKLSADDSTASTETAALDRIMIPNPDSKSTSRDHGPGIIIVDLTPSTDEGTIQSDISRIRNLMSLLPADRHYCPSILLLQWTESSDGLSSLSSEFNQLQEHGVIYSWRILTFANDGRQFDDQFSTVIESLPLDTVGKFVNRASIDDVFWMFFAPWDTTLNEWTSSCYLTHDDDFNWLLYGNIIAAMLGHINHLVKETLRVCQVSMATPQLPVFQGSSIRDQQTAYETVIDFLSTGWLEKNPDAALLRAELSMALSDARGFDVKAIPERLAHLMLRQLHAFSSPDVTFVVHTEDLSSKIATFAKALRTAYIQGRQGVQPLMKPMKRQHACDQLNNVTSSARSVEEPGTKRRRHDGLTTANDRISLSSIPNDNKSTPDPLSRLRATIAKARQSVEELRTMRNNLEPSQFSALIDVSDTRTPTRGGDGSEHLQTVTNDGRLGAVQAALFRPETDVDLSLIPNDYLKLIPARPGYQSFPMTPLHQSPPVTSMKSYETGVLSSPFRLHPSTNGSGSIKSVALPSPSRRRGAVSLTPRQLG